MKKFFAVLAGVALVVAPANAALRMFFSTTGVDAATDLSLAQIQEMRTNLGNPSVNSGARIFLWAEMIANPAAQKWNGISFDVVVNGGRVTSNSLYNYRVVDPDFGDVLYERWQGVNSGTIQPDGSVTNANLAAVTRGEGVNNGANSDDFDRHSEIGVLGTVAGSRTLPKATLLGFYDVALNPGSNSAQIFIRIGNGGIVRSGATGAEPIYLGVGDEGAGLTGSSFGQSSPTADATIVPEPASLALLGLAALALRRR
ncbi:MAG: PEP-CTERM sorting domain-containing protein [Planctomycetia bacterium]|nr:MAG: PEP-CTERM sorting domain-containing protein [Planctomycetia bacterium]